MRSLRVSRSCSQTIPACVRPALNTLTLTLHRHRLSPLLDLREPRNIHGGDSENGSVCAKKHHWVGGTPAVRGTERGGLRFMSISVDNCILYIEVFAKIFSGRDVTSFGGHLGEPSSNPPPLEPGVWSLRLVPQDDARSGDDNDPQASRCGPGLPPEPMDRPPTTIAAPGDLSQATMSRWIGRRGSTRHRDGSRGSGKRSFMCSCEKCAARGTDSPGANACMHVCTAVRKTPPRVYIYSC